MSLKRPVTLAQARRWPGAAQRRESFCARMGGARRKLTGPEAASDPDSPINRALAAWDCDKPALLKKSHVSKGVRPMKITPAMVGSEARKNPALASMMPTDDDEKVKIGIDYANRRFGETGRHYLVTNEGHSAIDVPGNRKAYKDIGLEIVYTTKGKRKASPAKNPAPKSSSTVYKYALVSDDGGFQFGMDDRTPVLFVFSDRAKKKGVYRSFRIPDAAVKNPDFQAWVRDQPSQFHYASLQGLRAVVRGFMK